MFLIGKRIKSEGDVVVNYFLVFLNNISWFSLIIGKEGKNLKNSKQQSW